MDELRTLLDNFSLTEEERNRILYNNDCSMPKSFQKIAGCMLSGCFVVSSEGKEDILVSPTVLEFYYHEEGEGGIIDPIVYHRDSLSSTKSVIPTGIFHNHVSGVDITFEKNGARTVRASVLIRAFSISGGANKASMEAFSVPLTDNNHSTHLYAALFSQFSPFDGFSVKWEDGDKPAEFEQHVRTNVFTYQTRKNKKGQTIYENTPTQCPRLWQAIKAK